jgi:hypothetical protein
MSKELIAGLEEIYNFGPNRMLLNCRAREKKCAA